VLTLRDAPDLIVSQRWPFDAEARYVIDMASEVFAIFSIEPEKTA
jgi:hypothetical protein